MLRQILRRFYMHDLHSSPLYFWCFVRSFAGFICMIFTPLLYISYSSPLNCSVEDHHTMDTQTGWKLTANLTSIGFHSGCSCIMYCSAISQLSMTMSITVSLTMYWQCIDIEGVLTMSITTRQCQLQVWKLPYHPTNRALYGFLKLQWRLFCADKATSPYPIVCLNLAQVRSAMNSISKKKAAVRRNRKKRWFRSQNRGALTGIDGRPRTTDRSLRWRIKWSTAFDIRR